MLIDTHAHLTDERFRGDLAAVLARGPGRVICVATTAQDAAGGIAIARRFPGQVSAAVGIHPNHAAQAQPGDWDEIVRLSSLAEVVAIGETGLDRHWDFTPFALQEEYFARHLALSRTTGKPVVIHARDAEDDVICMVRADYEAHGPVRGVLHSFAGAWEAAEAGLAMGLYVSFAGMLTYKNADNVRAAAARVAGDRLLVETDCPYLAPEPVRGKRCEPAHVAHTAARLAAVRDLTPAALADLTTANARRLFGLA